MAHVAGHTSHPQLRHLPVTVTVCFCFNFKLKMKYKKVFEILKSILSIRAYTVAHWLNAAFELRGCWFEPQLRLQNMGIEGSKITTSVEYRGWWNVKGMT